jgi:hypothetical protein
MRSVHLTSENINEHELILARAGYFDLIYLYRKSVTFGYVQNTGTHSESFGNSEDLANIHFIRGPVKQLKAEMWLILSRQRIFYASTKYLYLLDQVGIK